MVGNTLIIQKVHLIKVIGIKKQELEYVQIGLLDLKLKVLG